MMPIEFKDQTKLRWEFKLQDLWIGLYWSRSWIGWGMNPRETYGYQLDVYLCLIPMFPIHLTIVRHIYAGLGEASG